MNDRLEEFVRKNRKAFDMHEPDPSLWLRINPVQEELPGRRRLNWLRYAAAVAVIFAGFSAGIYYLTGAGHHKNTQYSELYRELIESESYYNQLVNQKLGELQPYLAGMPAIKKDLETDFNELDEILAELKDDLSDDVDNPEVIEAMIQNYRIKVEILEELLNQIKEKENENNHNHESVTL